LEKSKTVMRVKKSQLIRWELVPEIIIAPTREQLDWKYLHRGSIPRWLLKRQGKLVDSDKHIANGWWPEEKRVEAVASYAVLGSAKEVSAITGVPVGTLCRWMTEEWWHEMTNRVRVQKDMELDVKFTKVVDKAVEAITDRLENGDYVYNNRTQTVHRKPVTARDAASVTNIILDKRSLLRGMPTSRVERVSTDKRLEDLATEFRKFSRAKTINVIPEATEQHEQITIDVSPDSSGA
jgi:hypothetical protein